MTDNVKYYIIFLCSVTLLTCGFMKRPIPTGKEAFFDKDKILVSKTDKAGRITYANKFFIEISGYEANEIIGYPHSIIRHPDMPKAIFKYLWDTIKSGKEIFAYVKNLCKNGDHYWVLAHVTPSFDNTGKIIGYHSNRRYPDRFSIEKIDKLYQELCNIENNSPKVTEGMKQAYEHFLAILNQTGKTYDEFVFSI